MLTIAHLTNWYGLVKHKSLLAEEHKVRDFQSTMTVLCNLLPQ
jgi:hypothetical protein